MKRRLNLETPKHVFSLSANGVGGEGRGEVVRENQIPSPCPSPRLGGARVMVSCISKLIRVHPSRIAGSVVKK